MKKSLIEFITVFLFFFIIFFKGPNALCQPYGASDFDSQNFISWDYAAHKGAVLYKDVLYYYGILYYLRHALPLAYLFYILLTPILLCGVYFFMKSVSKSRLFSLTACIMLILIILTMAGTEAFSRYGISAVLSLLSAYTIFRLGLRKPLAHLGLGVLIGGTFSLVNDQGVYAGIVYALLIFFHHLSNSKMTWDKHEIIMLCKTFALFTVGGLLGFLPFAIYLLSHDAFIAFISSMRNIAIVGTFGKAPFLPYVKARENIFTLSLLAITLFSICYKFLFQKKSVKTLQTYLQIGMFFLLFLVEQKNITRSMGTQLIPSTYMLLALLLSDVKEQLQARHIHQYITGIYVALILPIVLFSLGFPLPWQFFTKQTIASLQNFPKEILQPWNLKNINACRDNIFKVENLPLSSQQIDVFESLKAEPDFNEVVFSFPSDPLFYVMFDQVLPPYSTTYEASATTAQKANIAYIQKNNIRYVIYNTSQQEMDSVPNYVRAQYLYAYLFSHYEVYKTVDQFLILKEKEGADFIKQTSNEKNPVALPFLSPSLSTVPKSEGMYKYDALTKQASLLATGKNAEELHTISSNLETSSERLVLAITFSNAIDVGKLIIETKDGLQSTVSFSPCLTTPCIIRLSNLPMFFSQREISSISFPQGIQGKVEIWRLNNDTHSLW